MRGGHIRHQRSPAEAVQSVPPDVFFPKHKSISSSGSSKKVFEGNKREANSTGYCGDVVVN